MDESKISLNDGWASHVSHRTIGKGFRLHTYITFGQQLLSDHQLNMNLGIPIFCTVQASVKGSKGLNLTVITSGEFNEAHQL